MEHRRTNSRYHASRSLSERFRFRLECILLRGLGHRLLLAALMVLVVSLLAGGLIALLEFSDPLEAVWWAFLRLTDPEYLGDGTGVVRKAVSMLVTLLGYLVFVGLLIAILAQWLDKTITKLERGLTPITVADHILILGCSDRTAIVVSELLLTKKRVGRFLNRYGASKLRIVVLVDNVDALIVQELWERLGNLWDDRRILLRSGSPLRLDHLERTAFLDAAVIVLPGADFPGATPAGLDAQNIKTLLSMSQCGREMGLVNLPHAVAAVSDSRKALLADRAYDNQAQVLAVDLLASRIIAQSVRHPGLPEVFIELLTLNRGSAIYIRYLPDPGLSGQRTQRTLFRSTTKSW